MLAQHLLMVSGDTEPKGQVVFVDSPSEQGKFSWVVPEDVYEIHAVVVGGGGVISSYPSYISRYESTVYSAIIASSMDTSALIGGGNGGAQAFITGKQSAGGGAGGYLGDGGAADTGYVAAKSGAGGGGGGGGYGTVDPGGGFGGRVGLNGVGASGAGGTRAVSSTPATNGGDGSALPGAVLVGGGARGYEHPNPTYSQMGVVGASLRYTKEPIAVTPGETLWIYLNNGSISPNYLVTPFSPWAGCRIMWGGGRSYPYNAGDV